MIRPVQEENPPGPAKDGTFGLPTATALVIGSVIGTGVFAVPSALAAYGPISLVAFRPGHHRRAEPGAHLRGPFQADPGIGGPYVYARDVGTPAAAPLRRLDLTELAAMSFPAGSMAPKIEACRRFVAATGRPAAIGSLADVAAVLTGTAGTTATVDAGQLAETAILVQ